MGFPNIEERKFSFCPSLSELDLNNLIVECPKCTRLFAACCPDGSFGGDMYDPDKPLCHYFQLVFTDGACSKNGQGDAAKAGLGIVISDVDLFWSIAVDDTLDTAPRTSQRAELLAAIEGLKKLELVPNIVQMWKIKQITAS
jgi:ribonuclease HI